MVTKVQKWGNSQGLRLSKEVLSEAEIGLGDAVKVTVEDGVIMITPARQRRSKHSLRDLVSRIPKHAKLTELDWGPPAGREVW